MMGIPSVLVKYQGKILPSNEALKLANIPIFDPKSKEGLALTNGTTFMASLLTIAYLK
jgi:histidine ammonia-lyase